MKEIEELEYSIEKLEIYKTELEAQNTELREIEEKLKEKSLENETLFLDAPIPYLLIDKEYTIVKWNKLAEKLFNINHTRTLKSKIFIFYFLSNNINKFCDWIRKKEFLNSDISLKLNINQNIETFKIQANEYAHDNDFIMISMISIQKEIDLFKESKRKDDLLEAQSKMALLGEMLNNISHQWRQPLSTITVAASGMKLKKEMKELEEDTLNEFVDTILSNANFLSKTIDDFRNLALNNYEDEDFDIKESIQKVINIFKSKLENRGITVHTDLTSIIYKGSESQLMQVLINFFSNSIDQFIESKLLQKLIFIKINNINNFINIEFSDNAGGIKEEIAKKIFEPYFTTKHKSIGTGIGLFMSTKIIKDQFRGTLICKNRVLNINNNEEDGATFIISLPIK